MSASSSNVPSVALLLLSSSSSSSSSVFESPIEVPTCCVKEQALMVEPPTTTRLLATNTITWGSSKSRLSSRHDVAHSRGREPHHQVTSTVVKQSQSRRSTKHHSTDANSILARDSNRAFGGIIPPRDVVLGDPTTTTTSSRGAVVPWGSSVRGVSRHHPTTTRSRSPPRHGHTGIQRNSTDPTDATATPTLGAKKVCFRHDSPVRSGHQSPLWPLGHVAAGFGALPDPNAWESLPFVAVSSSLPRPGAPVILTGAERHERRRQRLETLFHPPVNNNYKSDNNSRHSCDDTTASEHSFPIDHGTYRSSSLVSATDIPISKSATKSDPSSRQETAVYCVDEENSELITNNNPELFVQGASQQHRQQRQQQQQQQKSIAKTVPHIIDLNSNTRSNNIVRGTAHVGIILDEAASSKQFEQGHQSRMMRVKTNLNQQSRRERKTHKILPKLNFQKKPLLVAIVCLFFVVTVVVVVVVVVLVLPQNDGNNNNNNNNATTATTMTSAPVPAPSHETIVLSTRPPGVDIETYLLDILPETTVAAIDRGSSGTTPQGAAWVWLVQDQQLQEYSDLRLIQRLALATLYYATNGDDWSERGNWLSYKHHECTWMMRDDVDNKSDDVCSVGTNLDFLTGSVKRLRLPNRNLDGTLPGELGLLSNLESLILSENKLQGAIPSEFGGLVKLEALVLDDNKLSESLPTELGLLTGLNKLSAAGNLLAGSLPTQLGNLVQLKEVTLSSNKIVGSLPSHIGAWTALRGLYLDKNAITGSLPIEMGSLTKLEDLFLDHNSLSKSIPSSLLGGQSKLLTRVQLNDNAFTGTLSTDVGSLSKMVFFSVDTNQLEGTLPSQLGQMGTSSLRHLSLANNFKFSGPIPTTLSGLTVLQKLQLHNNSLTSTIPHGLSDTLRELSVDQNFLTGTIHTELGQLTNLIDLWFFRNQFTGQVPSELGLLTKLDRLELDQNPLTGLLPTELGNLLSLQGFNIANTQLSGTFPPSLCGILIKEFDCSSSMCGCECSCNRGV